ncbi:MAG TPA: hypothetical protein VHV78_12540, partial [Gemmatimonadaceae bacterium]|nr:hypothetical protein [Gemmatimonadaceae bacterium]
GCQTLSEPGLTRPVVAPVSSTLGSPVSFITASDSNARIGSTIVIAANVAPASDGGGIAAFRARLGYDASALEYVAEVPVSGMMRALNSQPNEVIVAGATATPTTNPQLFALQFRVRASNALSGLTLVIDELSDAGYSSQLKFLTPLPLVRVDRSLSQSQVGSAK